jgi:hypothetical protein
MQQLALLGWTQEEIADKVTELWPEGGLTRNGVSMFLTEKTNLVLSVKKDFDNHASVTTLSKRYDLPEIVILALALADQEDQARFKALDIPIQPYDVLHFQGTDKRFGTDDYPGRIPGQLVAHLLSWFTAPGDYVLDPMAGSGNSRRCVNHRYRGMAFPMPPERRQRCHEA